MLSLHPIVIFNLSMLSSTYFQNNNATGPVGVGEGIGPICVMSTAATGVNILTVT